MTKEFCTYEQSLALEELGFDDLCIAYFDDSSPQMMPQSGDENKFYCINNSNAQNGVLTRPLIQQAFRFFREKYGLCINIHYFGTDWFYAINKFKYASGTDRVEAFYSTYEEAEEACLDKLIEIAKEK